MRLTWISHVFALIGLSVALEGVMVSEAIAQFLPACQPPNPEEHLLMVIRNQENVDAQLQQTLPRGVTTTICDYLGSEVTRVGGFTSADVANAWAQYLMDIGGLQTFVTRSAETSAQAIAPSPTAPAATFPTPSAITAPSEPPVSSPTAPSPTGAPLAATSSSYNPHLLGAGYAVLVSYFNRPEVAADVQQVLTHQVGLVSYNQRPYLLALYTGDPAVAASLLRTLSDRNFTAMIVDSRRAVLLTPAVAGL